MVWLKFYEKERELFPVESRMLVASNDRIELMVRKLCKHFKISTPRMTFTSYSVGHYYRAKKYRKALIDFPRRYCKILMMVHEVSHHYNQEKYGTDRHNKKLMKTLKRLMKYCIKKDYWGLVINREYAEAMAKADEDGIIVKGKEKKKKNPLYGDTIVIIRTPPIDNRESIMKRIEAEAGRNNTLAKELRFLKNEVDREEKYTWNREYTWLEALNDTFDMANERGGEVLRRQCLRLYQELGLIEEIRKKDAWYDPDKAGQSKRIENTYGIWMDEHDEYGNRRVYLVEMKR